MAEDLRATGSDVLCIPTDLSDRASLAALAERVEGEEGGVDLLINNAGLELSMLFGEVPMEDIDQIIEVNLRAPIVLSRLLLPKMIRRGRGHVVNISSLAGLGGAAYQELYCATKHGLVGFTRSLRATVSNESYPVGCSVVCPGFIDDVGMYVNMSRESGVKAPLSFGTSPPERVARAVVRAVQRDVPEIVVNPMPIRPLLVVALFAPRFALWLLNQLGISRFFEAAAKQQLSKD